jgi:hypothetical protein
VSLRNRTRTVHSTATLGHPSEAHENVQCNPEGLALPASFQSSSFSSRRSDKVASAVNDYVLPEGNNLVDVLWWLDFIIIIRAG